MMETIIMVLAINGYFNKYEYVKDVDQFGVEDHWSTLEEFYSTSKGDCEDFQLAKWHMLKHAGIPEEDLYLAYVQLDGDPEKAHMVLLYDNDGELIVLDNNTDVVASLKLRKDFTPVLAFNEKGIWALHRQSGIGDFIGFAHQYRDWKEFLKRYKALQNPSG